MQTALPPPKDQPPPHLPAAQAVAGGSTIHESGSLTCPCGWCGPFDEFRVTASGVELPTGEFQCRHCGRAFARRAAGRAKFVGGVLRMPRVVVVPVPAYL